MLVSLKLAPGFMRTQLASQSHLLEEFQQAAATAHAACLLYGGKPMSLLMWTPVWVEPSLQPWDLFNPKASRTPPP